MKNKYDYLTDADFLKLVDLQRIKEQFAKITVLDWAENPVQDIIGIVTGGSLSVDASSAVRRTCNLNVFIKDAEIKAFLQQNLNSFDTLELIKRGETDSEATYMTQDEIDGTVVPEEFVDSSDAAKVLKIVKEYYEKAN